MKSLLVDFLDVAIFFVMGTNSQTDNFLESENLTLEVARKLLVLQQQQIQSQQLQIEQLKDEVAKLQGKNPTSELEIRRGNQTGKSDGEIRRGHTGKSDGGNQTGTHDFLTTAAVLLGFWAAN